jgi:hypothetical protein
MNLIAANDGYQFINTYSKSKTTLGRALSNFAHSPFTHPKLGSFQSIEGAWYYLFTGKLHDELRLLHGARAKIEGRKKIPPEWAEENIELSDRFKKQIIECIQCKLRQNRDILMALISTDLPLEHFYVYDEIISNKKQYAWALVEMDRIRKITQKWYVEKYGQLPNIPIRFID